MLYLLPPVAEFLSPARRNFYHQLLPVTTLTRGMLLDVLLLGVIGGIGFTILERFSPRVRQLLWLPVFFITSWVAVRDISASLTNSMVRANLLHLTPYIPWAILAIAAGLLFLQPRIFRYCVRGTAVILAAGGIALIVVILPQLVMACFGRVPREQASFSHPVKDGWRPGDLRVVWILFDELSFRQVFEHPQPGIRLPAFSGFAKQSVTFSQLRPVGYRTETIVPSLLLGQPVADMKGAANGNLLLRRDTHGRWQGFDQNASIFSVAKQQGWGTGVAGWYNPYCRILNKVLNRCYWTFSQSLAGELFARLSSRQSTWENARDGLPLAARLEDFWHHSPDNRGLHADYKNILQAGEALIQDSDIRLAFIHMPVPHPPGLFPNPNVRGEKSFDYLGNLILADKAMARLWARLTTSPAARNTVVIVFSDHSWRVPMWRQDASWTAAEERATDGGFFDERPVLMVHFPAQKTQHQIDRPESEMIVHGLLLDLIKGKVHTPEEWIATLPQGSAAENQTE